MPTVLDEKQIEKALQSLHGWEIRDGKLHKDFVLPDFKQAMAFMVRVGFEAEALQHHPEFHNVYNWVSIDLATHDADDQVTDSDTALAAKIEAIAPAK